MKKSSKTWIKLKAKAVGRAVRDPEAKLADLESRLGGRLPKVYRDFLLEHRSAVDFGGLVGMKPIEKPVFAGKDGSIMTGLLLGPGTGKDSLGQFWKTYGGRLPEGFLPIGDLPGGNLLCIRFQKPHYGKIYVWNHDHELNRQGLPNPSSECMSLAANSFQEYWTALELEKEVPKARSLEELGVVVSKLQLNF